MYEKKRYICIDKVNSCGNSRVYDSKCDYDKRLRYYLWNCKSPSVKSDRDYRQLNAHACYIYCLIVYVIRRGLLFIICPMGVWRCLSFE